MIARSPVLVESIWPAGAVQAMHSNAPTNVIDVIEDLLLRALSFIVLTSDAKAHAPVIWSSLTRVQIDTINSVSLITGSTDRA